MTTQGVPLGNDVRVRVWVRSWAPWLSGAGIEAEVVGYDIDHACELLEREDDAFSPRWRKVVGAAATEAPIGLKEVYPVGRRP